MKRKFKKISLSKTDISILTILIIIFGYFFLFFEVRELGDSFQYLNQFVTREPIYALLLQGVECVFGNEMMFPV